jgi:hypothetical protein
MSPEHSGFHSQYEPVSPLPPLLAEFLRTQQLVGLTHATDQGTILVLKAPADEIERLRGPVRIQHQHELYRCVAAPVIRLVTRLYDQPEAPLSFESFLNVQDPDQRTEYELLTRQEVLPLHFYDERLQHRLTKAFRGLQPASMARVLQEADRLLAAIPSEEFDFDYAKMIVMGATRL